MSYRGYSKPLAGMQIDWGHPLSRGLVACYAAQPGNILHTDLARGRANDLVNNNGATLVNLPFPYPGGGQAINPICRLTAASTQYLSGVNNPQDLCTGNIDWTLYMWVMPASAPNGSLIAAKVGAANADREFQIIAQADNSCTIYWWTNAVGGSANVSIGGVALAAGQWAILFAWHDAGANTINMQSYNPLLSFNVGTLVSQAATGGNVGAAAFTLGRQSDLVGTYFDGYIDNVQIRKRVLTQDERTLLARQPYCFFARPSYKKYIIGSTSTPALARSFPIIMG